MINIYKEEGRGRRKRVRINIYGSHVVYVESTDLKIKYNSNYCKVS